MGQPKRRLHNKQTKSLGSQAKELGDFISVDTMEAGTPGIIPYSTGHPPNIATEIAQYG